MDGLTRTTFPEQDQTLPRGTSSPSISLGPDGLAPIFPPEHPSAKTSDRCGITLAVDQGRTRYIKCLNIAVIQPTAFAARAGNL